MAQGEIGVKLDKSVAYDFLPSGMYFGCICKTAFSGGYSCGASNVFTCRVDCIWKVLLEERKAIKRMENVRKLLEQNLNIDFLGATLSNPKDKSGATKVKVRPILKQEVLCFQCEAHKNNQVFHNNYEASEAAWVLTTYMEQFKQMQMETKTFRYTVLVSKKGKVTIQKKRQNDSVKEVDFAGRDCSAIFAGFGSDDV